MIASRKLWTGSPASRAAPREFAVRFPSQLGLEHLSRYEGAPRDGLDDDEFEICDAQERRASTPTSIYMDTLHYVETGCTYLALRAWAHRVLIEVKVL